MKSGMNCINTSLSLDTAIRILYFRSFLYGRFVPQMHIISTKHRMSSTQHNALQFFALLPPKWQPISCTRTSIPAQKTECLWYSRGEGACKLNWHPFSGFWTGNYRDQGVEQSVQEVQGFIVRCCSKPRMS